MLASLAVTLFTLFTYYCQQYLLRASGLDGYQVNDLILMSCFFVPDRPARVIQSPTLSHAETKPDKARVAGGQVQSSRIVGIRNRTRKPSGSRGAKMTLGFVLLVSFLDLQCGSTRQDYDKFTVSLVAL